MRRPTGLNPIQSPLKSRIATFAAVNPLVEPRIVTTEAAPLDSHVFFAPCAKSLEPVLARELAEILGRSEGIEAERAGVKFQGTIKDAYRVCLWSRVANRVLLPLKTFPCTTEGQLYGGVKSIKWSDHMAVRQTLAVDFSEKDSAITHTHFGALKVKDAIVDQFRSNTGERPSVRVDKPDIRVNVYLLKDQATVSLDLSGESLHMRGYRKDGAMAPLKETLAAALLYLAEWPQAAREGRPFLDPMCGSGTLVLEAAQIAADIAPGLGRRYFGFIGWRHHDKRLWEELIREARERKERGLAQKLPPIFGSDQDGRTLQAARENAERAGLSRWVQLSKRSMENVLPPGVTVAAPLGDEATTASGGVRRRGMAPGAKSLETAPAEVEPGKGGVIVVNPPYGERLGEEEALVPLYRTMGDLFKKRFSGWTAYILTSNPRLAKEVGLQASRRFEVYNGPLECRLLKFDLYSGSRRAESRSTGI